MLNDENKYSFLFTPFLFYLYQKNPVQCQAWTTKLPKMAQPDLDFMAPEMMSSFTCSPQSDMFSFGLLIYSLFNHGKSPLEANLSPQYYMKQLDLVSVIWICKNVDWFRCLWYSNIRSVSLHLLATLNLRKIPEGSHSRIKGTSLFNITPLLIIERHFERNYFSCRLTLRNDNRTSLH